MYMNVLIVSIVLIYLLYYWIENENQNTRTLDHDGFCILKDKDALSMLPSGYAFLDYVYEIEDGALSTFHRDVTSSKTVYSTTYPVYTLIQYLYDGELLSVCPGSHRSLCVHRILNLEGKRGTCFLFDCDLLHSGRNNQCKERRVVQYKICHEVDRDKLSHLEGIRTYKKEICQDTNYSFIIRKLSYYFQLPLQLAYPLMIRRDNKDTLRGKIQSIIPLDYYNNV
jgi:hypothetical protein